MLLVVTASIDYSGTAAEKVLVRVAADVEGHCGEEIMITVADKSETFDLCEGDKRP